MQSTGYLDKRASRPGAIVAVAAIHAIGIGSLILLAPTITRTAQTMLIAKSIPLPNDPPEIVKTVAQTVKTSVSHRVPDVKKTIPSEPRETANGIVTETGTLASAGTGEAIVGDLAPAQIGPPREPLLVAPRMISRAVQPPYPPAMQRLGIEGAVTVRVLVSSDGQALRIEAVSVDQEAFFAATRAWALKHWRFAPATRDGVPYEEWRTMTVRFTMKGDEG